MRLRYLVPTLGLWACSSPNLDGTNFACNTDAECGDGQICGSVGESRACVARETSALRIGLSAPLQGPSADLGTEMRRGIEAVFQRVNSEGGIFGRDIELAALNDNYDPPTALTNCKELLDVTEEVADPDAPDVRGPNSVIALLGNVGTPPMLVTAPLATKNQALFFAPFTGAQRYLRDGTNSPYVYNYRASYYEETEAMVEFMQSFRSPRIITANDSYKHILAFVQNDTYGAAGYDGFALAYNKLQGPLPEPSGAAENPSITKVTYERENVESVDSAISGAEAYLENLLTTEGTEERISVGVFMIDTYQPSNKFIRAVKDWINDDETRARALDLLFINVSFVGSDALAQTLSSAPSSYVDITDPDGARTKTYAEGVMVTQVVPNYTSQAQGVREYRADIDALDNGTYSFTSLEGYIASSLFVEGLRRHGANISAYDSGSLVDTFDSEVVDLDLKIGTLLNFSSTNHQASHTVWGSVIGADGTFTIPFMWNNEQGIIAGQN